MRLPATGALKRHHPPSGMRGSMEWPTTCATNMPGSTLRAVCGSTQASGSTSMLSPNPPAAALRESRGTQDLN